MADRSDTAEAASRCTILISADCSREYGVLGASEEDTESWRERFVPMIAAVSALKVVQTVDVSMKMGYTLSTGQCVSRGCVDCAG